MARATAHVEIERMLHDDVDIVVISAPAGFGKTRLATLLERNRPVSARCDVAAATCAEMARRILSALTRESPHRAPEIAEARASLATADEGAWVESALLFWSRDPDAPATFVIDNAEALRDTDAVQFMGQLMAQRPASRRLVICSRRTLSRELTRHLVPHRTEYVGPDDLRLSDVAARALLEDSHAPAGASDRAIRLANGWPIAVLLFCRLARLGRLEAALTESTGAAYEPLVSYLLSEYLFDLSDAERTLLILPAALADVSRAELRYAGGLDEASCDRFLRDSPFLAEREDGHIEAHPLIATLIKTRYVDLRRRGIDRLRRWAVERNEFLRAAEIALASGDRAGAVNYLGRLGPRPSTDSLLRLVTLLDSFDVEQIVSEPALWAATLDLRRFTLPLAQLVAEGRRAYAMLPTIREAQTRFEVGREFVSILMHAGCAHEVLGVIADLKHDADETSARRLELMEAAALSMSGKYAAARRAFRRLGAVQHPALSAGFLDFIDATTALRSGDYENGIAILEESVRQKRRNGWIAPLLISLSNIAFEAWVAADDERLAGTIAELKASMLPALRPAWQFWMAAVAGDAEAEPTGYEPITIRAIAHLFNAARLSGEARVRAIRRAVADADASQDVGLRVLIQVARAEYDVAAQQDALATIRSMAEDVDLEPFRRSILRYAEGSKSLGALDRFVHNRLRRQLEPAAKVTFFALTGTVQRGGAAVGLSATELAIFTFIALHGRPVERSAICDAVWPESDDLASAVRNLNVVVHRLRKKLGDEVIVRLESGYCIGVCTYVDIRDCEAEVRKLASSTQLSEPEIRVLSNIVHAPRRKGVDALIRFDWYVAIDHRIVELGREATLILARHSLRAGEFFEAIDFARTLLETDPCDQYASEIRLRALIGLGDASAARAELRRFKEAALRDGDVATATRMQDLFDGLTGPRPSLTAAGSAT